MKKYIYRICYGLIAAHMLFKIYCKASAKPYTSIIDAIITVCSRNTGNGRTGIDESMDAVMQTMRREIMADYNKRIR